MLPEDPTKGIIEDTESVEQKMLFYIPGCCGPSTPIIHPDNEYLSKWILVGMLFVMYELFLTPYRMCFEAPARGPAFVFESIINSYC